MRGELMPKAKPDAKILVLPAEDLLQAEDSFLVSALKAGDPRAPRVIWQRFAGLSHRILRRSLGQMHDFEDLSQEVFLTFFRKVITLREPRALPSFIVAITNLAVRRELRRRSLRRWVSLGTGRDTVQNLHGAPANRETRQALGRFYDVLDKLKSQDRMVFVLRFLEGMELCEVAAALEISLSTTRRCMGRARARIEYHIGQDPGLVDYLSGMDQEPS